MMLIAEIPGGLLLSEIISTYYLNITARYIFFSVKTEVDYLIKTNILTLHLIFYFGINKTNVLTCESHALQNSPILLICCCRQLKFESRYIFLYFSVQCLNTKNS